MGVLLLNGEKRKVEVEPKLNLKKVVNQSKYQLINQPWLLWIYGDAFSRREEAVDDLFLHSQIQ
jgi:hypothetical protein